MEGVVKRVKFSPETRFDYYLGLITPLGRSVFLNLFNLLLLLLLMLLVNNQHPE